MYLTASNAVTIVRTPIAMLKIATGILKNFLSHFNANPVSFYYEVYLGIVYLNIIN